MGSWRDKLQFFGLVTLITCLVWLYAEGQNLRTERVTIRVTLIPPDQPDTFTLTPDEFQDVELAMQGSGERITMLRQRLAANGQLYLRVPATAEDNGRTRSIRIDDLINEATFADPRQSDGQALDTLGQVGVNIVDIQPAVIEAQQDQLVAFETRVIFEPDGFDVQGALSPSTIQIYMPRRILEASGLNENELTVQPQVPIQRLENAPDGQPQTALDMPLRLPEALRNQPAGLVRMSQTSVDVTYTVFSKRSQWEITQAPIWIALPPIEADKYNVVLDAETQFVQRIVIEGPADALAVFLNNPEEYRVLAYVNLSVEDLSSLATEAPIGGIVVQRNVPGGYRTVLMAPLSNGNEEGLTRIGPANNITVSSDLTNVRLKITRKGN